jgi:hypothetical protein
MSSWLPFDEPSLSIPQASAAWAGASAVPLPGEPKQAPAVNSAHGAGVSIAPMVRVVCDSGGPAQTVVGVGGTF